jgi:hypothetical protein
MRWIVLLILMLGAAQARAYCIYNQLKDRDVSVEQDKHPDALRDDRRMRVTLKPGESKCCQFHELDCNPEGRSNSVVKLLADPGTPQTNARPGPDPLLTDRPGRSASSPIHKSQPYISASPRSTRTSTGPRACRQEPRSKQVRQSRNDGLPFAASPSHSRAQRYPSSRNPTIRPPVTMIVPFPPGGVADITARPPREWGAS